MGLLKCSKQAVADRVLFASGLLAWPHQHGLASRDERIGRDFPVAVHFQKPRGNRGTIGKQDGAVFADFVRGHDVLLTFGQGDFFPFFEPLDR